MTGSDLPTPRKLALLVAWFWEPPHFGDRRIQACAVVVFCMIMIVSVYLHPSTEPINMRIIDWSFASLLGVVGIYHTARGFDELFVRGRTATASTQNVAGAEASTNPATLVISPPR